MGPLPQAGQTDRGGHRLVTAPGAAVEAIAVIIHMVAPHSEGSGAIGSRRRGNAGDGSPANNPLENIELGIDFSRIGSGLEGDGH